MWSVASLETAALGRAPGGGRGPVSARGADMQPGCAPRDEHTLACADDSGGEDRTEVDQLATLHRLPGKCPTAAASDPLHLPDHARRLIVGIGLDARSVS